MKRILFLLSLAIAAVSSAAPPTLKPAPLSQSVLIIIDAQKEYQNDQLSGFESALTEIGKLLARARTAGVPIIHVVHTSKASRPTPDPQDGAGFKAIVDLLKPLPKERIVEKHFANSFTQTTLESELQKIGKKDLIIVGFMTHMCVSATTREGAERGYRCTVVGNACATKDLSDGQGGLIPASAVQAAHLAALADRLALVVPAHHHIAE